MSAYEIYAFLLCLIVLVLLTAVLGALLFYIARLTLRLIRSGAEDANIKKEYGAIKKGSHTAEKFGTVLSWIFCVLFCLVCAFATYLNLSENSFSDKIPSMHVVKSASMATKHEKNTYLTKNNLNDQFQTFDLIITHALPAEEDLRLYDIIVYEVDDTLVIHRIVGIEEPNQNHEERWFLLQGDAVEQADRFPVRYSQMRAIYRGQRIPFIGSFVSFMQSPAGYLCVVLVLVYLAVVPKVEKKIEAARKARFDWLTAQENEKQRLAAMQKQAQAAQTCPKGHYIGGYRLVRHGPGVVPTPIFYPLPTQKKQEPTPIQRQKEKGGRK